MDLTVGVVSYNTRETTCVSIEKILEDTADFRKYIVLGDNGSTDETIDAVTSSFPEVITMSFKDNPGYGGALNRIFKRYPSRYLMAVNADVFITRHSTEYLLNYMDDHPRCAIAGPSLFYPDGNFQPSCKRFPTPANILAELFAFHMIFPNNPSLRRFYYGNFLFKTPAPVDTVSGSIMLIRSSAFQRVGGFDSHFWLYFEETDLCRRLRNAGYTIAFVPQARAVHLHAASTRKTLVRQISYYHSCARYAQKHFHPLSSRLIYHAIQISALMRLLVLVVKYLPVDMSRLKIFKTKFASCVILLKSLRYGPPKHGAIK